MDAFKEQHPKTAEWITSLHPFIIIRGEKNIIIKFSDGRETLHLSFDKIAAFENKKEGETFNWQ